MYAYVSRHPRAFLRPHSGGFVENKRRSSRPVLMYIYVCVNTCDAVSAEPVSRGVRAVNETETVRLRPPCVHTYGSNLQRHRRNIRACVRKLVRRDKRGLSARVNTEFADKPAASYALVTSCLRSAERYRQSCRGNGIVVHPLPERYAVRIANIKRIRKQGNRRRRISCVEKSPNGTTRFPHGQGRLLLFITSV